MIYNNLNKLINSGTKNAPSFENTGRYKPKCHCYTFYMGKTKRNFKNTY